MKISHLFVSFILMFICDADDSYVRAHWETAWDFLGSDRRPIPYCHSDRRNPKNQIAEIIFGKNRYSGFLCLYNRTLTRKEKVGAFYTFSIYILFICFTYVILKHSGCPERCVGSIGNMFVFINASSSYLAFVSVLLSRNIGFWYSLTLWTLHSLSQALIFTMISECQAWWEAVCTTNNLFLLFDVFVVV